jgi:peptidoglycan biosynthesis protein MviN/MurJ (putative lipid II flippase)
MRRASAAVHRLLAKNTFRALLGTLAGNAIGFLLPFAVTSHYGLGRLTDAYFFALGLAIFGTVLSATVIEANALPLMNMGKRGGASGVRRAARRVAGESVVGVFAAYIPVAVCGSLVVANRQSWPMDLRESAITLTAILTLLVAIVGVTSVLAAVLYTFDDFLWPTATQSFRSIAPMVGLFALGRGPRSLDVLAVLMIAGEVLRGAVLAVRVRRRLSTMPEGEPTERRLPSIWRAAGPHAVAMIGVNLMPVVDKVVATRLKTAGSVTLLDLGEKILYVPLLGVTYSVILVAGARWAELGSESHEQIRSDFARLVKRIALLSSGLGAICIAGAVGFHIVRPGLIAGVPSGKLAAIVVCFMIGLPAAAVTNVGSRLFTALGRTRYLPWIAILLLLLDIVFDLIGAKLWGTNGIALATTAVRFVSAPVYVAASLAVVGSLARVSMAESGVG